MYKYKMFVTFEMLKFYVMKKLTFFFILLGLMTACNNYSDEYNKSQQELASARDSIRVLQKQVMELSYPANQRLDNINKLIKAGDLDAATAEIDDLVALFPKSNEAQQENSLRTKIEKLHQAKIEEEKRIKALGFKVLKDNMSVSFGDVKASFSGFQTAKTFTFDSYDDNYRYFQADKNQKYISASMSITSSSSNPKLPQCAVYFVNGDVLEYSYTTFITRFARWDDYGSYLGNYADFNNDFSKVNTVRFKIGAEVKDENLKRPFVVVLKKEGVLERKYEQFSTPEISYSGYASFASTLTLADVGESGQYAVVKRYNFDKL